MGGKWACLQPICWWSWPLGKTAGSWWFDQTVHVDQFVHSDFKDYKWMVFCRIFVDELPGPAEPFQERPLRPLHFVVHAWTR